MTSVEDLRRYAIARSFFAPTTLKRALQKMGFVQADPIRAPARAQDLVLRHRVRNYHAGDLERRYSALGIEEDFFISYGFVTKSLQALMHPRFATSSGGWRGHWPSKRMRQVELLLDFVRERGAVHPREVDARFLLGSVRNYWGGSSNATTHLLDAMHYRGLLRVARRERGIRVYAAHGHGSKVEDSAERNARIDALVDVIVNNYAPLPARSLSSFVRELRFAVPQWHGELTSALVRARKRLSHASINGVDWYWASDSDPLRAEPSDAVRLLAPFDPVVRDRRRFELFWGWGYRFEAYTPARKRERGYYALPLLWRDRVVGWGNLSVQGGQLHADLGYVDSRVGEDVAFRRGLEEELDRMRVFLRLRGQD